MWTNLNKEMDIVKAIEKQAKKDGVTLVKDWYKDFAYLIDTDGDMLTYLTLRHRPTKTMITTASFCNTAEDDFNSMVGVKICANRMARNRDFLELTLAKPVDSVNSLEDFLVTMLGINTLVESEVIWDC